MEVIEQPTPIEVDLETEAGLTEFLEGSLQHIRYMFSKYGTLKTGILCIATRLPDGTRTDPFVLPMIDVNDTPHASLVAAFRHVAAGCRAVGVVFFAEAWTADFADEAELAEWGNRPMKEHPSAYPLLHVSFDHQTMGHRTWQARVTWDSATGVSSVGRFELEPELSTRISPGPFSGFLQHLNDRAS